MSLFERETHIVGVELFRTTSMCRCNSVKLSVVSSATDVEVLANRENMLNLLMHLRRHHLKQYAELIEAQQKC